MSVSSLGDDREMAVVYGPAGIPVYWIVNVEGRQVEVNTRPGKKGYRSRKIYASGEQIPVTIGDQQLPPIAVDDLLPPRATRTKGKRS